ncbi:MAG: response regulator transcription factor [Anaerolineales bacterium]
MSQQNILVVDDEVGVAELFSMMLEMEGYRVRVVHDVQSAKTALEEEPVDLMFVDIMMPEASGLELCRYVRGEPYLENIPIVIVSARSQLEEVHEGLEAGADRYLLKPVSKRELIEAVQQALTD